MPQTLEVDVAIIGGGTAGMAAYEEVVKHTDRVVIVDTGPWGTTCARVGCMPSKLLIAAAQAAHAVADGPRFGVGPGTPQIDGAKVMKRVQAERDRFVASVTKTVEGWPAAHRITGRARFLDDHLLEIDQASADAPRRIRAARIVIATGASAVRPADWQQSLGDLLVTHEELFDWPTLPRSVAVVGAGPLGLELAQALHRLQVRVRLYDAKDTVGGLTSPALQSLCSDLFGQALALTLNADKLQVRRDGNQVVVGSSDLATPEARFDRLLAAMGRTPNVKDLGLDRTSLPLDDKGVPLFDRHSMQVGTKPVFIAGDAADDWPVLHEAADDGRIAGAGAATFPQVRVQARRTRMQVTFSSPQLATAGQGFGALKEAGVEFETGCVSFSDQGRARAMGIDEGELQVYGESGTGRVLGAEMIGPGAEHLAHLLAWSVARGDTVEQMLSYPFYHPTLEEGLRTALRDLQQALGLGT